MARFADYVQKQSQVDQELNAQPARQYNIPESVKTRFAGKTPEEIMESFAEAQALISRQGQELGELRKTTQTLMELQSKPVQQVSDPATEKDVNIDDLYEDTEGAIATVVKKSTKETSERVEALERELAERRKQDAEVSLEKRYPGWKVEASKAEFVEWVKSSPVRTRLAVAADSYDLDAANDLLELWYDRKQLVNKVAADLTREQQFRDATLESASPSDVEHVPTFQRYELQEKRIAAANGSQAAQRWLEQNAEAIRLAYREGRVTD
jgi:hypothetical protein